MDEITTDGLRLVKAFEKIVSKKARKLILELAEELAKGPPQPKKGDHLSVVRK